MTYCDKSVLAPECEDKNCEKCYPNKDKEMKKWRNEKLTTKEKKFPHYNRDERKYNYSEVVSKNEKLNQL